jgi:hypothetical protein
MKQALDYLFFGLMFALGWYCAHEVIAFITRVLAGNH